MVTSCYGCKPVCGRPTCCWLSWWSVSTGDPNKSHCGRSGGCRNNFRHFVDLTQIPRGQISIWASFSKKIIGQWFWLSWQSGRFLTRGPRLESSYQWYFPRIIIYCQVYWKDEKRKRCREWPIKNVWRSLYFRSKSIAQRPAKVLKMCHPRPLFCLFSSFRTKITICTTNKCE